MHDDQHGLLDAIAANPDDDHDRRVYADWLEDHGDGPRAEFVRIQLALARLPEGHPQRTALLTRERGLLLDHEQDWTLGLRHLVDRWEFRRGFVDEVVISDLPGPLTARRFDELFAFPFVRRITSQRQGWRLFPGLIESEGARRLEELHVELGRLETATFRALVECPRLEGLRRLALRDCGLRAAEIRRLVSSDLLGRLRELDLSSNDLQDDGIAALVRSPRIGGLTRLDLSSCRGGHDTALALASAPLLAGLRSLRLGSNFFDDGIAALLRSPHLAGLRELDLSNCRDVLLGPAPAEVWSDLFSSDQLGRLTDLNVADNQLSKGQVFGLLNSPRLGCLRRLDLSLVGLTDEETEWCGSGDVPTEPLDLDLTGLECRPSTLEELLLNVPAMRRVHRLAIPTALQDPNAFAAMLSSPHLINLRHLSLSPCRGMDREMLIRLLRSDLAGRLNGLDLGGGELSSADVVALAKNNPHLANLSWLSLRNNHVGSSGARALAESPYLGDLRHLDLSHNHVGDEGAHHLAQAEHLASPVVLDVSDNEIGPAGMEALFTAARRAFSRGVTIPQDQP
jgi:uncharacterized protein (TIGR02996 family)